MGTDAGIETPSFMGPFKDVPPVIRRAADPAAVAGAPPGALPFQIQVQQQTQWCWAAVAASVTDYFNAANGGAVKAQCELASDYAKPSDCCADPAAEGCNEPSALETVLGDIGHLEEDVEGRMEFADIVTEIATRKSPVCCKIAWTEDLDGHYVVIMGCHDDASQDVIVLDPAEASPHCGAYPFEQFKTLAGGHWTNTMRTK